MRPVILTACFVLLAAACNTTPSPPTSPAATVGTSPGASPAGIVWEEYHSDNLAFSLQLPRGWQARRAGPSEGEVLRATGGDAGTMIVNIDVAAAELTFEEYIDATFRSMIAENPDSVQTITLPGGRAARGVAPRTADGGVSVIYAFAPRGDHAKLLSFTWDQPEPNPLWHLIAERFNAYVAQPIIPFVTPSPPG